MTEVNYNPFGVALWLIIIIALGVVAYMLGGLQLIVGGLFSGFIAAVIIQVALAEAINSN